MTDYPLPDADDRAAQEELQAERYERTLDCLYEAAMLGLSDDRIRHLCAECGIPFRDLQNYTPPLLRPIPKEDTDTRPLPW